MLSFFFVASIYVLATIEVACVHRSCPGLYNTNINTEQHPPSLPALLFISVSMFG